MKKILLIFTLLITMSGFSQSNSEDYYYETYLYEQYKTEKQHMMLAVVGSFGMGFMAGRDFYYNRDNLTLTTTCFAFSVSGYSIYKLIKLKKEIKEWEKSKSRKVME